MYELLEKNGSFGLRVGNVCVYDVAKARDEVEDLLICCIDKQVSALHIYDIIENWFAEAAYQELDISNRH